MNFKKILSIYCIIFLILIQIPLTTPLAKLNKNYSSNILLNDYIEYEFDDDSKTNLPAWKIGDNWIYTSYLNLNIGNSKTLQISLTADLENLFLRIVSNKNLKDLYVAEFNGDMSGEISINSNREVNNISISGYLEKTKIYGKINVIKTNLGIKNMDIDFNGKIRLQLPPVILNLDANVLLDFHPYYKTLDFPLTIGKTWGLDSCNLSIQFTYNIAGYLPIVEEFNIPIVTPYSDCEEIKPIIVEAGSFNAYEIIKNLGFFKFYYSPEAENIIKSTGKVSIPNYIDFNIDSELTSTMPNILVIFIGWLMRYFPKIGSFFFSIYQSNN